MTAFAAQETWNASARLHSPQTVNNWLVTAEACWNWAAKMKLLTENPFQLLKLLNAPGCRRVCTADEFKLPRKADATFRPEVVRRLRCEDSRTRHCRVTGNSGIVRPRQRASPVSDPSHYR